MVLAAGIGLFKWHASPLPLRLITIYFLYALLSNTILIILTNMSIRNIFMFHIGILVIYPLLGLAFSQWQSGFIQRLMLWSIPIFVAYYLFLLVLGLEGIHKPPAATLSTMSLLLIVISLCTLRVCLGDSVVHPVYRDERFWIATGTFLSFGSTAFIYSGILHGITMDIWPFHNILHTLGNLCYFAGYLWMRTQTTCSF